RTCRACGWRWWRNSRATGYTVTDPERLADPLPAAQADPPPAPMMMTASRLDRGLTVRKREAKRATIMGSSIHWTRCGPSTRVTPLGEPEGRTEKLTNWPLVGKDVLTAIPAVRQQ